MGFHCLLQVTIKEIQVIPLVHLKVRVVKTYVFKSGLKNLKKSFRGAVFWRICINALDGYGYTPQECHRCLPTQTICVHMNVPLRG